MSLSLFTSDAPYRPLADKCRPGRLADFQGQSHILAPGKPLYEAVTAGNPHSMILWGPPGTGKTTLARIIAAACDAHLESLSAVLSGVKEIRQAIDRARQVRDEHGRKTILFVDEVHRFNKSQQDAFLPHIEDGTVVFIGATTENPSFELNNALLSWARIYVLKSLDDAALTDILRTALNNPRDETLLPLQLTQAQEARLVMAADGDARRLLNLVELALDLAEQDTPEVEHAALSDASLEQILQGSARRFDKGGDSFYEQISALHKSVRGSAPDAALYWLCRMLDGGCDPLYVARRVVRMASEDIGNADPRALSLAINAWDTQQRLGSPEGELAIAQAVVYMACAAKSNAVYTAYKAAMKAVQDSPSHEVPMHLRNAPTSMMKDMNYGGEYRYAHDEPDAYAAGENYMPEALQTQRFYFPEPRGLEEKIRAKLEYLRELDASSTQQRYRPHSDTEGEKG